MRKLVAGILFLMLLVSCAKCETLRYGMRGNEVSQLQQALIDQGYLNGKADGIFGSKTENAVRDFQAKNGLKTDGLAGKKTQAALYGSPAQNTGKSYFSGDYSTIEPSSDKARIRLLQKALIKMNYLKDSADGVYGTLTRNAVRSFQREQKIREDGTAGAQTLETVEKALASGHRLHTALDDAEPLSSTDGKISAPSKSSIELLHWYNDIKPLLNGQSRLVVYEPGSGLSWTLRVYSRGRHLDAEPLTLKDTQIMLKAFGNRNTWAQKGVYVMLPDGRWTIGSTHTAPHLSGHISNNGFDGHLCVHFFRDMDECAEKDPNYGVKNQKTIRALWKKVSGETVE